jgi:hypothetical protein
MRRWLGEPGAAAADAGDVSAIVDCSAKDGFFVKLGLSLGERAANEDFFVNTGDSLTAANDSLPSSAAMLTEDRLLNVGTGLW